MLRLAKQLHPPNAPVKNVEDHTFREMPQLAGFTILVEQLRPAQERARFAESISAFLLERKSIRHCGLISLTATNRQLCYPAVLLYKQELRCKKHATNMAASENTQKFYPDVVTAGGLNAALSEAFTKIGSSLAATGLPEGVRFVAYGRIERGNRFSQVYIAAEERLFLFDFWRDGVIFANASTPEITDAAKAIDKWVADECAIDELRAIPFVTLKDDAKAYDQGRETEGRWTSYLRSIGHDFPELVNFVTAAADAPQLRQLFPYTSLNRFCFSRCTGYPFTYDTPYVHPQQDGSYNVYSREAGLLGSGDAPAAVQLVIANLPPNCGPAVRGTAETMNAT